MVTKKEYTKMVTENSEKSPILLNCIKAFLIGGLLCLFGEGLINLFMYLNMSKEESSTLCSITLIFIGAFLTCIGVYHKIAKHAGAGTLVPITGFSNAVASSAIEFKTEGFLIGTGAKMFIIAGPVIVYGILSSFIYGIVLWLIELFFA